MSIAPFVSSNNLVPRGSTLLKIAIAAFAATISLSFLFGPSLSGFGNLRDPENPAIPPQKHSSSKPVHCSQLRGAEDVLVIIKTGATELESKLPVHLRSTTSCYSDTLIFSDYEEDLHGFHIHDVLEQVSDDVKLHHDDFALYRRLKAEGRSALRTHELSGPLSSSGGVGGKTDNPGWRLDKWKFLPMMNKTLTMYPDKKWYVFAETDTYLVWSNLLAWLNQLNSDIDIYAGFQMQIGDQIFAHGGSGFIVSNAAMRLVTDLHAQNTTWWEAYTDFHWAGDCVLGKAFQEAGSPLLWSWPLIQGDKPSTIDFFRESFDTKMWCAPAVTYHHLAADEVEPMWRIEQDWLQHHGTPLKHKDIFKGHILPYLSTNRDHWDNLSGDLDQGLRKSSLHQCRELCQSQDGCLQYRLARGKCMTSDKVKLGEATKENIQSGWMEERIDEMVRDADRCVGSNGGWITRRIVEGKQR